MAAKKPNSKTDHGIRAKELPAQRLWARYVVLYNYHARKRGLPRIHTLADLAQTRTVDYQFLPEDEVLRMRLEYYADWINALEPLAEGRFHWLAGQTQRARRPRSGIRDLLFLLATAPHYSEFTNRELWNELIAIAGDHGVTVNEVEPDLIEWDVASDASKPKLGSLGFRSFESRLSLIRNSAGTLKRARKR